MKKFEIDSQQSVELFFNFIFHLSIGKVALNFLKSVLPAVAREQRVLFDEKICQKGRQAVIQTFSIEPEPLSA
jgi:hypothetical protein